MGDNCYLFRDLGQGCYGGDVFCLQRYLRQKGHFDNSPSAYYGTKTEEAVERWQKAMGLQSTGRCDVQTRRAFAKTQRLPTPDEIEAENAELRQDKLQKNCLDVCASFRDQKFCHTRCVRDAKLKIHACKEACQVAYSEACDREFPGQANQEDYLKCLNSAADNCQKLCGKFQP